MNKLLTIVIPTYNMQAYLRRCLDSLILSDKQMQQLEVIVINDGSKDNSSAIAHEYETKYPDTFRVIDKENGNYGSCVNRGLKEAMGKYIKVLDADDWFDTSEFDKYLVRLQSVDVDMVLTDFSTYNADTQKSHLTYHPNLDVARVYDIRECHMSEIGVYMMHAITYRTSLLCSIGYMQTTGISYTDNEWTYNPLYAVSTIVYFDCNVYQYLIGREGQTMDSKVLTHSINHFEIIVRSLIENNKLHPSYGFSEQTIQREINLIVEKIYKTRLVLQDASSFNHIEMMIFDQFIKVEDPTLHSRMGKLVFKKNFPIPYVLYWRIFKHRFPIDKIRNVYRNIKYGK